MASQSCPIDCFVAGTLVHTRSGPVPIEQIKVGDLVLSHPDQGGELQSACDGTRLDQEGVKATQRPEGSVVNQREDDRGNQDGRLAR